MTGPPPKLIPEGLRLPTTEVVLDFIDQGRFAGEKPCAIADPLPAVKKSFRPNLVTTTAAVSVRDQRRYEDRLDLNRNSFKRGWFNDILQYTGITLPVLRDINEP
ncbi:hypothetical protein SAMD00023353_1600300 [Rosellinia necatrix]|uniref:Uncharacterized protein n=1 Tax=Rosellinia necatrix TaxID=77044 RepID=A0A1W2TKN8_ROSNE|nr:hypothetical protein SAMD00023353_1600300 [Rosellinia necatrix]